MSSLITDSALFSSAVFSRGQSYYSCDSRVYSMMQHCKQEGAESIAQLLILNITADECRNLDDRFHVQRRHE